MAFSVIPSLEWPASECQQWRSNLASPSPIVPSLTFVFYLFSAAGLAESQVEAGITIVVAAEFVIFVGYRPVRA